MRNWTTRGYANSQTANSRTGRLADWTSRGLVNSRTGQLAVSEMPTNRKTKHAKLPMASASCPVTLGWCTDYRHFGPVLMVPMCLDTSAPMCDKYEQETRLLLIQLCLDHNRLFCLEYISTSLITGDAVDIQALLRPVLLPCDIHRTND